MCHVHIDTIKVDSLVNWGEADENHIDINWLKTSLGEANHQPSTQTETHWKELKQMELNFQGY